jgi:hypothetical protein
VIGRKGPFPLTHSHRGRPEADGGFAGGQCDGVGIRARGREVEDIRGGFSHHEKKLQSAACCYVYEYTPRKSSRLAPSAPADPEQLMAEAFVGLRAAGLAEAVPQLQSQSIERRRVQDRKRSMTRTQRRQTRERQEEWTNGEGSRKKKLGREKGQKCDWFGYRSLRGALCCRASTEFPWEGTPSLGVDC